MNYSANETSPDALLLNRYQVKGFLGEGGIGTVVKAFDTRLKRPVAIKTLKRSGYTASPDLFHSLEERFVREAEAGSRVGNHPNLVTVYDLVTDSEQTQYLVLEYVGGGTLADFLGKGPLRPIDALRITAAVASGLDAAHQAGIVHRDVKPANIFLNVDSRVQLGDFGIAQIDAVSGRSQVHRGHPGTPLYMSPEQEQMTAYLRPSSDQYSLGLVLFELLTGHAYKRLSSHHASAMLGQQRGEIQLLLQQMLAHNPDDRYPSMRFIINEIRHV